MSKNDLSTKNNLSADESQQEISTKKENKVKKVFGRVFGYIKNHKILTIIVVLVLIAAIIGVNIYQRIHTMQNAMKNSENRMMTTSLTKMDLTSSISVTGTIASADSRSISTTLTGTEIEEVNVSVGDYVNEGDVIITFDSTDLEEDLQSAENTAKINSLKNQKTLNDAAEAVTEAQENYDSQAAGLQEDVNTALSNYNNLAAKRDAALTEYQNAQAAVQTAQSELDTLKAQAESEGWAAKVSEAKAALDAAQAEYDKAEAVSDIDLTSSLYDALQAAKANYNQAVAQYETPLTNAQNNLENAKQKESQTLASYEEYSSQADAAYGAYYGKINTQTETNEKNADQIEESEYNYTITALEQENNKITQNDQIQEVEEKLGKTVVTAPISGVITSVNVEAGDTYEGGTLFVVQDMEHFIVEATVDEYDISDISKDMKAVVKTDATDDEEMNGTVTFVAPTPQSSSDSSGTNTNSMSTGSSSGYEIQITLDDYNERIRIGMTAKTSIILESAEDVYAVAYDCVKTDEEGKTYIEVIDTDRQNDKTNTNSIDIQQSDKETKTNSMGNDTNSITNSIDTTTMSTTRIYVETGMESDYYIEIISDELYEGMKIVATESSSDSTSDSLSNMENMDIMPGGDMGGDRGGNMGGNPGGGGMPGGGF